MDTKVILKRSSVPGKVPAPADMDQGELALNTADGKLFAKKTDNTVVDLSAGGGDSSVYSSDTPPTGSDGNENDVLIAPIKKMIDGKLVFPDGLGYETKLTILNVNSTNTSSKIKTIRMAVNPGDNGGRTLSIEFLSTPYTITVPETYNLVGYELTIDQALVDSRTSEYNKWVFFEEAEFPAAQFESYFTAAGLIVGAGSTSGYEVYMPIAGTEETVVGSEVYMKGATIWKKQKDTVKILDSIPSDPGYDMETVIVTDVANGSSKMYTFENDKWNDVLDYEVDTSLFVKSDDNTTTNEHKIESIVSISAVDYSAIVTPDPGKLYIIKG